MSVLYSEIFDPLGHGPNLADNESLQSSFCQNLLGTDQTRLFMMISISFVHSLSFSSLPRITISVYYESFENCVYLKVAGNCSNHLSHDDFHIRVIFCKL